MGKPTGFMEYERRDNTVLPPKERIRDFCEFRRPVDTEERRRQAARCMNCGVPFCQSAMQLSGMVTGCPLHNLIPEWNDQIYRGHMQHAFSRLYRTSDFPEFTGRVCPSLCEKACMNGEFGDPVTIHENELFLIETAFQNGYIRPIIPDVRSGKKVAVIGSGPSGLAVADVLNHRGHTVTVYERDDRIGGLLMYGIPNMKLDKRVIARRQKLMEEEGVRFITGVNAGVDISAEELKAENDAVVLCCGAKQARKLDAADPETDKGVVYAVDFLTRTTKAVLQTKNRTVGELLDAHKKDRQFLSASGKHVVVVGGGDTGNDCIGTCVREGCASITALEMMPEPPAVRTASNPWPEWPKVKKTDYGHEEAIAVFGKDPRVYETTVKQLIRDKRGALKKIETVRVKFENRKMVEIEGSEKTIPCDLLIIAAGFIGCQDYVPEAFDVALTGRHTVATAEDSYYTGRDKVFTAGDMRRGQSLVVWAIAEGRACAAEVDRYLMGYTNLH